MGYRLRLRLSSPAVRCDSVSISVSEKNDPTDQENIKNNARKLLRNFFGALCPVTLETEYKLDKAR